MITPVQDNPALMEAVAHRAVRGGGESFAQAMASQAPVAVDQESKIREAAQQLVATAFITPMLEQLRNDPFKSDLFHGGFAEDAFGQQLDTILADRISQKMGGPIADAVYRSMRQKIDAAQGVNAHG